MKRGETFLSEEIKELHRRPFQRDSGPSVGGLSGRISHTWSPRSGSLSCAHTKAGDVGVPRGRPPADTIGGSHPLHGGSPRQRGTPLTFPSRGREAQSHFTTDAGGTRSRSFFMTFPASKRITSRRISPKPAQSNGRGSAFVSTQVSSQQTFPSKAPEAKKPSLHVCLHGTDTSKALQCLSTLRATVRTRQAKEAK